jgi:acyl-CoA thioester hydrolase
VKTIYELAQPGAIPGYNFVMNMPVRFQDLDGMGHMNNVSYFVFVETARLEYFIYVMGLTGIHVLSDMPFILAGQSIHYRSPSYWRETMLVGVRTSWIKRSSFGFDFELREKESGRLVADGNCTNVAFDYVNNKSFPVSQEWVTRFEEFEGRSLKQESK